MPGSTRYAFAIVRSTPEQDERLRLRLQAAVDQFAGGSADKFGQLIGYANGGYVRECLNRKKPVRESVIERVHAAEGMAGWFNDDLSPIAASDVADRDERALLAAFRALPPASAARARAIAYLQGLADASSTPRESGEGGTQDVHRGPVQKAA